MNIRFEDKNFSDYESFVEYVWNKHKIDYDQDEYPTLQEELDESIEELEEMLNR